MNLMRFKRLNSLIGRNKPLTWAIGAVFLILIAALDHATKIEYGFGLFYILPVALYAWHLGLAPALAMSAACGLVWFGMDYWDYRVMGEAFAKLPLICWNTGMASGIFFVVSAALSELRRSYDRERAVAKLKGDMLSLVSHEFNNSLTTMGMALLLLRENDERPEQRREIYPVLERIHRVLKNTVANFLNQARMESGRFSLDIRQFELRRLVDEVADLLRPLCAQKEIALDLDFPQQVFPVNADPDAIVLVVSNLIGNAIKYTPKQGRVTVRIRPLAEKPAEVEVSVEDTGIGIAPKDREAIFSGFYRTDDGRKEARGFGVGLKVSRDILLSHESRLDMESAVGQGSRFFFRLPICAETCPHRNAGLCHRCRGRNPRAAQELYDGGLPSYRLPKS